MGGKEKGRQQGRGQVGRGQALRQGRGQKVGKMVDRGTRGKGAGGMVAGWGVGNPALRESAPRSAACDWPHVAMVTGAASTEIH